MTAFRSYTEVGGNARECDVLFFFLDSLLRSRTDTKLSSNMHGYDEDVNVYISHLLMRAASPEFIENLSRYVSPFDTDVFQKVVGSKDARLRYDVYKVNADYLLLGLGIFDGPMPLSWRPCQRWRQDESVYLARAKAYYMFAASYGQMVFGKDAGIVEVLSKLSSGLERYVEILKQVKGAYLSLFRRLTCGEAYHLSRVACGTDFENSYRKGWDTFLDAYLSYGEKPSAEALRALMRAGRKLRGLEPRFDLETFCSRWLHCAPGRILPARKSAPKAGWGASSFSLVGRTDRMSGTE